MTEAEKIRRLKEENKALQRKISELQKKDGQAFKEGSEAAYDEIFERLNHQVLDKLQRASSLPRDPTGGWRELVHRLLFVNRQVLDTHDDTQKENEKLKKLLARWKSKKGGGGVLEWITQGAATSDGKCHRYIRITSHNKKGFTITVGLDPYNNHEYTPLGSAEGDDFFEVLTEAFENYKDNVL